MGCLRVRLTPRILEFSYHWAQWPDLTQWDMAKYMCWWTGSSLVQSRVIGIDTKILVIVVSPTTWQAHHNPRAKPEGCGELPRTLVTPQWPKSRYQFLFYHDASKHIKSVQIRVCISRKSSLCKAWPQTIVTAASLVTSWLPLWCHSDARVTKSWQYASLKN